LHSDDVSVCNFRKDKIRPYHFEIIKILKEIADDHHLKFVDLTPFICDGDECKASRGNVLIYRDDRHLSREGSRL
jgi:lysophospholipase L1-like esterase